MTRSARYTYGLIFAAVSVLLVACGGGGGGSSSGVGVPSAPSSTATPTPLSTPGATPTSGATTTPTTSPPPSGANYSVSGTLTDYITHAAISGATVTIGTLPNTSTCIGYAQCGSPGAPTQTAVTASDGTFTISSVANGNYFLQIANDANPTVTQTYTILHRSITVNGANLALGSVNITALTSQYQAWIATENADRKNLAVPSTGPAIIDEYAQEDAVAFGNAQALTTTQDLENQYASAYTSYPGAIGLGGATLGQGASPTADYTGTQASWFAEAQFCPNSNWSTCPYANAGHYINLANDSLTWLGVAESATQANIGNLGHDFVTVDVFVGNSSSTINKY